MVLGAMNFADPSLDMNSILQTVDLYRGFNEPFEINIDLIDFDKNNEKTNVSMQAYIKDSSSSYIVYTLPIKDKNKKLLMVGNNMWFYSKSINKPIRISPRQKLLGKASNADIARTSFHEDYNPINMELINSKNIEMIKLELVAKNKDVAYSSILLYITKDDYKPIKAEFFAISGKKLKEAYFNKFADFNGRTFVSEVEIRDSFLSLGKTILSYSNYKQNNIPSFYFNPDYLPRL